MKTVKAEGRRHNPKVLAFKSYYDRYGKLRPEENWIDGKKLTKEEFDNRSATDSCNGKVVGIDGKKYELKTVKANVRWTYHKNGQLASEEYKLDDRLHNPHGPAYKAYYENGKLQYKSYYINGKPLTKEEFDNRSATCNGKIVEIDGKKYELKAI